jgi:hypothetical protein
MIDPVTHQASTSATSTGFKFYVLPQRKRYRLEISEKNRDEQQKQCQHRPDKWIALNETIHELSALSYCV